MVLPAAGDAEIFAGIAFLLEPGAGEKRAAREITRQTASLEPMQPDARERKVAAERRRRGHITLPRKGPAHPAAQSRRLRNAAPDLLQADAAGHGLVRGDVTT